MSKFIALILSMTINPILVVGILLVAYMEGYSYAFLVLPFLAVFIPWDNKWYVWTSILANLIVSIVMVLLLAWNFADDGFGLAYALIVVPIILVGSLANIRVLVSNENL